MGPDHQAVNRQGSRGPRKARNENGPGRQLRPGARQSSAGVTRAALGRHGLPAATIVSDGVGSTAAAALCGLFGPRSASSSATPALAACAIVLWGLRGRAVHLHPVLPRMHLPARRRPRIAGSPPLGAPLHPAAADRRAHPGWCSDVS